MIRNYFKIAWRNLSRSKAYGVINITGLAIGMGVAMLIGLWIHSELSFDKNFRHYGRIARVIQNVTNNGEVQTWMSVPYPLAEELRKNYGSDFKHISMAVNLGDHLLTVNDKKIKASGGFFEKEAIDIFTPEMLKGQGNISDPSSILLSASSARAYFGSEDPINRLIKIDNLPPVKVVGVFKDFPENSTFADVHFISSWEFLYKNDEGFRSMEDPWRPNFASLFVELNNHVDISRASLKIRDAKLKMVNTQLAKKKPALFLYPMDQWHLYSEFKNGVNAGGAIQYVWMFGMIAVFVLLLACINFMNLATARSEKRAKEVGIRKTVGSLRKQIITQFFGESIFTTLVSFALSLLLVQLILPFFNELSNKQMSILWTNGFFWLASFAFILFTALVAGSYPALYLSSFKPVSVLKGTFKAGRFAAIPRKILVVIQFTVSIALIIGTIIVYRQIQFAKNRPVGYSREGLITIPTASSAVHDHFEALKNDLNRTGSVASIAEAGSPTTSIWGSTSGISWPGKDPNLSVDFGTVRISDDYGKTIGWRIKEGRDFSRDFGTDTSALILNEAAVRFMGLKKPVGTALTWFGQPYSVIGVINDMVMQSPYETLQPIVYAYSKDQGNLVIIKIKPTENVKHALGSIESIFKKFNPEEPFEYQFVDSEYAKKFTDEERIGKLASFFALLAVLISCLGLFGLASFVAEQRKKEIGIRKILGASVLGVWNLLSRDFALLVIISIFISVPVAWYTMNKWLQNYSYRASIDWKIFLVAGVLAIAVALLTVSFQAIRAAVANPVKSLRTE